MTLNSATTLDDKQIAKLQEVKEGIQTNETNYYQLGKLLVEASQTKAPELYTVLLSMNHYDIGSYASVGTRSAA